MYKDYKSFEEAKQKCRSCLIGSVYDKVVLSCGCKTNPRVIILGEAPGKEEVLVGEPFVGKAGKLLRSILKDVGFKRSNALISNIIPCRPENNKFPQDVKLVKDCYDRWLKNEIALLQPNYLLLLGAQPLKYVLGMVGISSLRGQWYDIKDENGRVIKCMPTFHPSYVLRKEYMAEGKFIKQAFIDDIKAVAKEAKIV